MRPEQKYARCTLTKSKKTLFSNSFQLAIQKGLVRPILEYDSCVWDLQGVVLQDEIEKVQNRTVRFVTSNYCFETGCITVILEN